MRAKTWAVILAIPVVGAALFLDWSFRRAAYRSERDRLALIERRPRREELLRMWEQIAAGAERRSAESMATAVNDKGAEVTAPGGRVLRQLAPDRLKNDPELQVLRFKERREEMARSYGPLFTGLKLTRAEKDRLLDASIAFETTEMDLRAIGENGNGISNAATIANLKAKAKAELQAAELAVLGPDGLQELKNYDRSLPARDLVAKFAGGAALAGAAVTSEQASALTQAIADMSPAYQAGKKVEGDASKSSDRTLALVASNLIDWKAVDSRARGILTPEQMKLFVGTDLTMRWTQAQLSAQASLAAESQRGREN